MKEIISKFNLYEYFRILLPGFYFVYIFSAFINDDHFVSLQLENGFILSLLIIVFALISGTLIYAIDLCRFFKKKISNLPTNLMSKNHPTLYPAIEERLNEHKYYSWYNNADQSIRNKTELQSGLYHLSMNFSFVSLIGIFLFFFSKLFSYHFAYSFLFINTSLFILSVVAAFIIVTRRLSYLWESNYWSFEEAVILRKSNDSIK